MREIGKIESAHGEKKELLRLSEIYSIAADQYKPKKNIGY
jgi:hypothetical protein|tara:strand:+ start:477 stop:596 length:120 start_codon:yes stop_codon:yes gene_type:complete